MACQWPAASGGRAPARPAAPAGCRAPVDARPRVSEEQERLDLTQIDVVPVIRARLLAAGEMAGVCVLLSKLDGPALRRP